ncbi:MAG TPA: phosphatidate cytidylyltransferase [Rubricoccaceae bacterium]|nr:phosphatidate cytidylyltransferase [Rubricoccaceae bacterium]
MSNLLQRILAGLVAAPVALALAWLGGWAFAALVAAVALAAQAEVYGLLRKGGTQPLVAPGLVMGALAVIRPLVPAAGPLLVVVGVLVLFAALLRVRERPILDVAGTLFGVFYPALLLSSGVVLREAEGPFLDPLDGFWLTAAVMVSVWGADTFAYAAGRLFGRHPLFPRVSPKKTWEGAAGGLLGAFAVVAAFKLAALDVLTWADVVVLALCAGVAGPLGDLTESLFKRSVDVKDSGRLFPGHGGMLDRIDAAVVAVPLAALYLDHVAGVF